MFNFSVIGSLFKSPFPAGVLLILFGMLLGGLGLVWWALFSIALGISFLFFGMGWKPLGIAILVLAVAFLAGALALESDWLRLFLESEQSAPE